MSGAAVLIGPGAALDRAAFEAAVARASAVLVRGGGLAPTAAPPDPAPAASGIRIALLARPSVDAVVAFHAAVRLGATVATVDPRLAPPELARLLDAVAPTVVVADDPVAVPVAADRRIVGVAGMATGAGDGEVVDRPDRRAGSIVLVPTSGTTGRRRLSRLPWPALEASARAWAAVLPPATGWLLSLGLGHVAGIGIVVRAALADVPLVVPGGSDTESLVAALAETGPVSHLSLVPTQLARLLDAAPDGPPPGIRAALVGGGPIPPALVVRAVDAGWPVVPSYGMTETASGIVALSTEEAHLAPGAAGRPLPGVGLRIAEPRDAAGTGRIEVRGPMVFAGYADDPAATEASLGPDGWLRTGDLGRLDPDGRLVVVDRIDDVVISGGENVVPAAVEAVLLEHPAVADVAVVGMPDPTWGAVPVAAVVPTPGARADAADLRVFARARLAAYEVPSRIVFVGAIPRTDGGKLRRRDLRPALKPAPLVVLERPGPSPDAPVVLLLHATLSSSRQLRPLAHRLAAVARVLAPDRRGSGGSPMATPATLPLARHVADALDVLDAAGVRRAVVVGHSFGGVVALELAARHPDRVAGVLAYEPPYLAVAPGPVRAAMADLADRVAAAHAERGGAAAAELFLGAVAGPRAWAALHPRQRAALSAAGDGVLADIAMPDLDPDGLARIAAPAILATGAASEPFYRPIAEALAARIPGARAVTLPDLRHPAPITDPDPIAALVRDVIAAAAASGPAAAGSATRPIDHEEPR